MLNLSSTQRKNNYYLNEIDIVSSGITTNTNNIITNTNNIITNTNNITANNNSITTLQNNVTNIQANEKSPSTIVKPFNDDCVAYFDFSDPLDIGRDCTGNGNHAFNQGVEYKADDVRTHTAYFQAKVTLNANDIATNQAVLSLTNKIEVYRPPAYSISLKFKVSTEITTSSAKILFAYGFNTSGVGALDQLIVYAHTDLLKIQYTIGGVLVVKLETPFTTNVFNHLVLTNDSNGHKVYINGVLTTPTYINGAPTNNINVSTYTDFDIGAVVGELDGRPDVIVDEYQYPFNGWLSDFSFWNRKLNAVEVLQLKNDNYGYCVYILAGQSNMVSRTENVSIAEDYDMSKQKSKVYTYNAHGKLSNVSPYTATYEEPFLNTDSNLPFLNIARNTVGLWKTFADDLITYTTLPFRKRVLLLPIAYGGTGFSNNVWNAPEQIGVGTVISGSELFLNPNSTNTNALNVLSGFLWNQGEDDINSRNINYKANFLNMLNTYQTRITGFNKLTTPIVVAEIAGNNYDRYESTVTGVNVNMKDFINRQFRALENEYTNITTVKTLGKLTHRDDAVHYDQTALRKLGYMYYDAYCKSVQIQNRKPQDKDNIIVINSKSGNRDIMLNCDTYYKPSPIYKNIAIDMYINHSMTITTQATSAFQGTFDVEFIRFGALVTMRLVRINFTATATFDIRGENKILSPFLPKENTNYMLPAISGGNNANRMTVEMIIFADGTIMFQRSYNDGVPADEKFTSGTAYIIYGTNVTYMAKY
jgi:hypothetical protein